MMITVADWELPPTDCPLPDDEIHLWLAGLEVPEESLAHVERWLDSDERARAARFHFENNRRHFIAARGILREVLSRYFGQSPDSLRFAYGPNGKPTLADSGAGAQFRFNLSHSHSLALLAVARGREVGVDMEKIRSDFGGPEIARRFFSPAETAELLALPAELQAEGFFNGWTRKEAYIKAMGRGLEIPLDSFEVSLAPGTPVAFRRGVDSRWSIGAFSPAEGYTAALVAEGPAPRIRFWRWAIAHASPR